MKYSVSQSRQTSGCGDYIVKYEADIELLAEDEGVRLEILSTIPSNAASELVERTVDCIKRGAELVLLARHHGAVLRLSRLAIHPVDFKAHRFEQITAEELAKALDAIDSTSRGPE